MPILLTLPRFTRACKRESNGTNVTAKQSDRRSGDQKEINVELNFTEVDFKSLNVKHIDALPSQQPKRGELQLLFGKFC